MIRQPKRKKSWVRTSEPSTSTPKQDIYEKKVMLCIWWDQDRCNVLGAAATESNQLNTTDVNYSNYSSLSTLKLQYHQH